MIEEEIGMDLRVCSQQKKEKKAKELGYSGSSPILAPTKLNFD